MPPRPCSQARESPRLSSKHRPTAVPSWQGPLSRRLPSRRRARSSLPPRSTWIPTRLRPVRTPPHPQALRAILPMEAPAPRVTCALSRSWYVPARCSCTASSAQGGKSRYARTSSSASPRILAAGEVSLQDIDCRVVHGGDRRDVKSWSIGERIRPARRLSRRRAPASRMRRC